MVQNPDAADNRWLREAFENQIQEMGVRWLQRLVNHGFVPAPAWSAIGLPWQSAIAGPGVNTSTKTFLSRKKNDNRC
jgi:hypothetical protein